MALRALVLVCVVCLAACSGVAAKGDAESAVVQFHQRLDAASYDEIYDAADDQFKAVSTRDQFTKLLRAIHEKLGNVMSSNEQNFSTQDRVGTDAGSYVQLVYATMYATGKGTETFVFRVESGKPRLHGYNISSADLITR